MLTIHLIAQAAAQTIRIGDFSIGFWWWPFVFAFLKNTFLLLDLLLVVAIVLVLGRFATHSKRVYEAVEEAIASGKYSQRKAERKWGEAQGFMQSERLEDRAKALAAAENILNDALKAANFSGDSLEARLAKIPEGRLNFQDDLVWAAKFRARLETDPSYEPDAEELNRAFYVYERSLKDLGIL